MDKRGFLGPANPASISEGGSWPSAAASRPLSDIREQTEPSLLNVLSRKSRAHSLANSHRADAANRRRASFEHAVAETPRIREPLSSSSEYSSTPDRLSFFAIPQTSIPRRSSSQTQRGRPHHVHRLPPQQSTVPHRGHSRSPVKDVGRRLDPVTSDSTRRPPLETVMRNPHPVDILDFPHYKHPRMRLEIQLAAPIFVGGGTIEGFVKCIVDGHERFRPVRSLTLGALSLDLLGFEEARSGRKTSFLSLGAELIDAKHPPPCSMARSAQTPFDSDGFWPLSPSTSCVAFCLSLPLDTGPAPFTSKYGSIRFVLSATAVIREASKYYNVRVSENVEVLPTYDPEKILASLPIPLTTSDEIRVRKNGTYESVSVTAGLHRSIWVSGNSLFADVHISNRSRKAITRLRLSLERDILCHKYAVNTAATRHGSGGRVVQDRHQAIVNTAEVRTKDSGWHGVDAFASDTRTIVLEIPRGNATVQGRRYLEVQYFLNITVFVSRSRSIALQLPITVVHMNSLDAVPNSVAQVAAAIEERRGHDLGRTSFDYQHHSSSDSSISPPVRGKPHESAYTPGGMFAAPRKDWMARYEKEREDLLRLGQAIDASPRKYHTGMLAAGGRSESQPREIHPGRGFGTLQGAFRSQSKDGERSRNLDRRPRIRPSLESLQSILTGRVRRKVKESISVPHVRTPKAILGPHALGMAPKDENGRAFGLGHEVKRRPSQRSWRGSVDGAGRSIEAGWI